VGVAVVFATAFAITLASVAPAVRAVAIKLTEGDPIAGIYAAATASDLLIGEVCEQNRGATRGDKLSGVVREVPRRDIAQMLVTTNGSISDALGRIPTLLSALGARSKPRLGRCTGSLPSDLESIVEHPGARNLKPGAGYRYHGVPGVLQGP
jgi:hypothetical protein